MRNINIKRIKSVIAPLTLAGMIAMSAAVPAFAADDAAITGSPISQLRNAGDVHFPVVLNGVNQAPTSTELTTAVVDNSGNAAGWSLTMSASQFTSGLNTLPATALTVSAASSASNGAGTYTAPDNTGTTYPVQLSTTPASYFEAAADSGMGQFTVSPTLKLAVPAATKAGTYTSTLTLDIAAGPA